MKIDLIYVDIVPGFTNGKSYQLDLCPDVNGNDYYGVIDDKGFWRIINIETDSFISVDEYRERLLNKILN